MVTGQSSANQKDKAPKTKTERIRELKKIALALYIRLRELEREIEDTDQV